MTPTIWTQYASLVPDADRGAWKEHLSHLRATRRYPSYVRTFLLPVPHGAVAAVLTLPGKRVAVWQSRAARHAALTLRGPAGETLSTTNMTPQDENFTPEQTGYVIGVVEQPEFWVIDGAQPLNALQINETQRQAWAKQDMRANRLGRVAIHTALAVIVLSALGFTAFCLVSLLSWP